MKENSIILSITIPTVNRAKELEENLQEILPQLEGRTDVEICVCDNACEDDTESVVKRCFDNYRCISTYKRYEERVPGRENFKRAVNMTSGEYVLLMGDDDILAPYFVQVMIDLLKKQDDYFQFVHFNRMFGTPQLDDCRLFDFRRFVNIKKYEVPIFIEKYLASPTFMSSIVFRKSCWDTGLVFEKDNYYGYEWLSQILFGGIKGTCLYCYFPLVLARNSYRPWQSRWPLYGMIGLTNLFSDLSKYNASIIVEWQKVLHNNKVFLSTISYMALDKKFYRGIKDEVYACLINKWEHFIVFLIMYVWPSWFTTKCFTLLLKIYYAFKVKVLHQKENKHLF